MRNRSSWWIAMWIATTCTAFLPLHSFAADSGDVRAHAEHFFDQLQQHTGQIISSKDPSGSPHKIEDRNSYSSDQYLVGKGQGDLGKGPIICQRVSELAARTDLAKQIRVLVKEHMIDRVRERTGREAEQDIELTREEIVQEYLQGVKIVDRRVAEDSKTCSATAVMPKNQILPKPELGRPELTPTVGR